MAYPDNIQKILKKIPKEYHKDIGKIIEYYHKLGVEQVLELNKNISEIPSNSIGEYFIAHDSEIDGG